MFARWTTELPAAACMCEVSWMLGCQQLPSSRRNSVIESGVSALDAKVVVCA